MKSRVFFALIIIFSIVLGFIVFLPKSPQNLVLFNLSESQLVENLYSVMIIEPEQFQQNTQLYQDLSNNYNASLVFVSWLLSSQTIEMITSFIIEGQRLFTPLNSTILTEFQKIFPQTLGNLSEIPPTTLLIGGTTSLDSTGILNLIKIQFEKIIPNISIFFTIKGSGAVLSDAQTGNLNVIITHAPQFEQKFVNDGFAKETFPFFASRFILIGPEHNPAEIQELESILAAFQKIYISKSLFISRGDLSGTHLKELEFWTEAELEIQSDNLTWVMQNSWYIESGSGQVNTFNVALEKEAYMLIDEPTYLILQ